MPSHNTTSTHQPTSTHPFSRSSRTSRIPTTTSTPSIRRHSIDTCCRSCRDSRCPVLHPRYASCPLSSAMLCYPPPPHRYNPLQPNLQGPQVHVRRYGRLCAADRDHTEQPRRMRRYVESVARLQEQLRQLGLEEAELGDRIETAKDGFWFAKRSSLVARRGRVRVKVGKVIAELRRLGASLVPERSEATQRSAGGSNSVGTVDRWVEDLTSVSPSSMGTIREWEEDDDKTITRCEASSQSCTTLARSHASLDSRTQHASSRASRSEYSSARTHPSSSRSTQPSSSLRSHRSSPRSDYTSTSRSSRPLSAALTTANPNYTPLPLAARDGQSGGVGLLRATGSRLRMSHPTYGEWEVVPTEGLVALPIRGGRRR